MQAHKSILSTLIAAAAIFTGATAYADPEFFYADRFTSTAGGGEIISFDKFSGTVFGTYSQNTNDDKQLGVTSFGVDYSILGADGQFGLSGSIDVASYFAANLPGFHANSLTSVVVDPLGRGFGAAVITSAIKGSGTDFASTWSLGKLVLFDTNTKSVITTFDTGYHPDMVTFSADGSKLIIANEGEFQGYNSFQAPGSLSVVSLSGIGSGFAGTTVQNYDFSAPNLGAGVSLTGLRDNTLAMNTPTTSALPTNIEPEYVKVVGNTVVVSLQENNALATFDLTTNQWTQINRLGSIVQVADVSDSPSGTISITKPVKTLPMPDGLDAFSIGSVKFFVTANEGDFRFDDGDKKRVSAFLEGQGETGKLDPSYAATLDRSNTGYGRLSVSTKDGDTDGDGDIDEIILPGSRSFSIWDAAGALVFDSNALDFGGGKFGLEQYIAANDLPGFDDTRSDDKGPEPEGITLGVIEGDLYAFLGLERTNHVFMFKLKDDLANASSFSASDVSFIDAIRTAGEVSPEGLVFISAEDSPSGLPTLLVGNEVSGSWTAYTVGNTQPVPEPSTALFLLAAATGLTLRRRRTQA